MEKYRCSINTVPDGPGDDLELVQLLWNREGDDQFATPTSVQPYLEFRRKECSHALNSEGRHLWCRKHDAILEIASAIFAGTTKEKMREQLGSKLPACSTSVNERASIDSSIDLTARLVSMMDIGTLKYEFSADPELIWDKGSLRDLIIDYFVPPPQHESGTKFESSFKACNLQKMAGIRIVWTSNLADHLRIFHDEVAIFHHASFLESQKNSAIFPSGFAEETLQTLAQLFPQNDRETIRWYRQIKQLQSNHIDAQVFRCGSLGIQNRRTDKFQFWHSRLVELKELYDEQSPNTLAGLWSDRRDLKQWHSFWLAILALWLTAIFGLLQSIVAILQLYQKNTKS